MKTKTVLIGALILVAVCSVKAFETYLFPGWDNMVKISPNILIAICKSSPGRMRVTNLIVIDNPDRGGIVVSDIQVVSVLKGGNVPEGTEATLQSQYWRYQGEEYLIFATSYDSSTCQALDAYRVVPLGHFFPTNILAGKSLEEQIKTLLQYRLNNVNRELEHGQAEKARLEQSFPPVRSPQTNQK